MIDFLKTFLDHRHKSRIAMTLKTFQKTRPVSMDFLNLIKDRSYFQFAKKDRNDWCFYHW